jgi:hypothetical protein
MAPKPTRKHNTPAAGVPSSLSSAHLTGSKKKKAASPTAIASPAPVVAVAPVVYNTPEKKAGNPAVAAAPGPVVAPDSVAPSPVGKPAPGSEVTTTPIPHVVELTSITDEVTVLEEKESEEES